MKDEEEEEAEEVKLSVFFRHGQSINSPTIIQEDFIAVVFFGYSAVIPSGHQVAVESQCAQYLAGNSNTLWIGFLTAMYSFLEQCVTLTCFYCGENTGKKNQQHVLFPFKGKKKSRR